MIKCLECGFETERLQWTHFKYKCPGKFKSINEYKTAYPDAVLVDPILAKKSSITLDNFINKYGEIDGKVRWNRYREKQAYTNSYEYKKEKYGWTKEQYDDYNSSRAQTLEKMIKRYGEDEGAIKWMNYCERQRYTNTLSYFKEKYGNELGLSKFRQVNKQKGNANNPRVIAERLEITVEEAIEIILSRNNYTGKTWGSTLEQEFVNSLEKQLGFSLEYTTFTKPYGIWSELLNTYVIYDIKHKNCIIEFNGDYWHANPKIYKDEAVIRGTQATSIRQKDMLKLRTATNKGFITYTVWESDYKENKEKTLKEVCKWMQNGLK
jgi:hypothetical protein